MTYYTNIQDHVWKALSDAKRRAILDSLIKGPRSTGDIVSLFPTIGRTGVLKHLDVLKNSELITIKREGRTRWNYINPAPIAAVCGPWVTRHIHGITQSAADLKALAENSPSEEKQDPS